MASVLKSLGVVTIFGMAMLAELAGQSQLTLMDRPVSSRVTTAALASPVDFLDALRSEGIPVGLHVTATKWQDLRFNLSRRAEGNRASTPSTALLDDAVGVFLKAHPGWSPVSPTTV